MPLYTIYSTSLYTPIILTTKFPPLFFPKTTAPHSRTTPNAPKRRRMRRSERGRRCQLPDLQPLRRGLR